MQIENQNFLITGANRGIGLAVSMMAARQKAKLHLVMRKPDVELEKKLKEAGAVSVKTWVADLSSREGVTTLLKNLEAERIDILFNNAGVLTGGLIEEQPLDDIYTLVQVNIASLIHLTKGLVPAMIARKSGKIINHGSVSSFMYFPCASTYAASKAAVMAFTSCLQSELKPTGVTTLCLITPGVKTRMFDEIDVKYSKNLETPKDSISTDDYALQIQAAIEDDREFLYPKGATALGLWTARHLPGMFQKAVSSRFTR